MSRRHLRTAGLIATVVAGSQLTTPDNAWAATPAPGVAVSVVGTVASVRAVDSTLVVTRAYMFRDSRPKTVRFTVAASTAVTVNGSAGGLTAVRTGMPVSVAGTQTNGGNLATRVVAGTARK
ncbi:hypothetical protein [Dactylosporangium sp. NPDC005555]|uniref:hypothetical protein n=1 Tax=Dactylosporangium sp. NPDC005555 TaxID=3154889 RepID=UPI0033ACBAAF